MKYQSNRDNIKSLWTQLSMDDTDQKNGISVPSVESPFDEEKLIKLPDPLSITVKNSDVLTVLQKRMSQRKYSNESFSMTELSFLLWAAQGIRETKNGNAYRTVASAGSRSEFDTYFYAERVEGLEKGLYRYIATRNAVVPVNFDEGLRKKLDNAMLRQLFNSAMAMFFVCVPYRIEWKYSHNSDKLCLLDAGHIGQNSYIAAGALGVGTCSIAAYNQKEMDSAIGVDGENELVCYMQIFGKL